MEYVRDPYPFLERFRTVSPIWYSQAGDKWYITSFDDVSALLKDPRLSAKLLDIYIDETEPILLTQAKWMSLNENPYHASLRRPFVSACSREGLIDLTIFIEEQTENLLEELDRNGEIDLVRQLAIPLTMKTLIRWFAIPQKHRQTFIDATGQTLSFLPAKEGVFVAAKTLLSIMNEIRIERGANSDADDLFTYALTAGKSNVTDEEIMHNCIMIVFAAYEGVIGFLPNAVYELLQHPAQLSILCEQPEITDSAIEELLRFCCPLLVRPRKVVDGFEFKGHIFRAQSGVALFLAAANRDPAHFDRPNELLLTRQENQHLSFAPGSHHCLGAHLVRTMARIVINALFLSGRKIALSAHQSIDYFPSVGVRGLRSLKVELAR